MALLGWSVVNENIIFLNRKTAKKYAKSKNKEIQEIKIECRLTDEDIGLIMECTSPTAKHLAAKRKLRLFFNPGE